MTPYDPHDTYPNSRAYRELQPLRLPAGWAVGWNELFVGMDADLGEVGGSSVFNATNEGRRFNIDIEFRPEFDPEGAFHMTVRYQPWPRTERGGRRHDVPFAFGIEARTVHTFDTRSYPELVAELERWIARCTHWTPEGH